MSANESRYTIVSAEINNGGLSVIWDDGHKSLFHAIWLRHQCTCADCGTPLNAVRGIRLHHIPENIAVDALEFSESGVMLTWSDDGHQSRYQARWLREHCYSASERAARKHKPISVSYTHLTLPTKA